jgi:hypothetical protein
MDAAGQRPPHDDTPSSTPTEPITIRLKKSMTAHSRRDATKYQGSERSDPRDHDINVKLNSDNVVFGFYCGSDYKGRYGEIHITRQTLACLNEWDDLERAEDIRRQAEARRRNIRRIMETLKALGSPLCDIAESMLQGYDRMASDEEAF